jgi:D-aminopeptidase
VSIGALPTGERNGITDVPGILVGHATLEDAHTGVTAVVPAQLGPGRWTLPAAVYTGNGHGKLVGSTQVDELGVLESPVVLTATLSVFRAADALLGYLMERRPDGISFNPLVGETNDGHLADIRARPIIAEDVLHAIRSAASGPVEEGCVGAGAGTTALGYKGGIGTSSRRITAGTVGALVQSNFGGTLTVGGVPLPASSLLTDPDPEEPRGNSCMIVLATDVPLDARQLRRVAKRAVFAMARVGASFTGGSGDYAIVFTTAPGPVLPDAELDPVFTATMDAVEEALLNSVFTAVTTTGVTGRTSHAVPLDTARARLSVN